MTRSRLRAVPTLLATLAMVAAGLGTASASAAPDPMIRGVVVDGAGHALLGVTVTAKGADGTTVATDLSYEYLPAGGEAVPGAYALHVPRGTYSITFTKAKYETATRKDVAVARGHLVVTLADLTLRGRTATSGKLVDDEITVDDKGKVKVIVTPPTQRPTGTVTVKEGGKSVGSATLKGKHKGQVTVVLGKLKKGKHELRVTYGGSSALADSTSGKLTLTVKAAKKDRQRPNALAFVG